MQLTEEERNVQQGRVCLFHHAGFDRLVVLRNDNEHGAVEERPVR